MSISSWARRAYISRVYERHIDGEPVLSIEEETISKVVLEELIVRIVNRAFKRFPAEKTAAKATQDFLMRLTGEDDNPEIDMHVLAQRMIELQKDLQSNHAAISSINILTAAKADCLMDLSRSLCDIQYFGARLMAELMGGGYPSISGQGGRDLL